MKTGDLRSLIASAAARLATSSDSPRLDAQLIAAGVLGRSREWLIAHDDEAVCDEDFRRITSLVERRACGEPVAYLTGTRAFWKSEFRVTHDTLIPRPETELLVETLLVRCDDGPLTVVDLGTGSGAIAVSLARERPGWKITATDLHTATLDVAKSNALDLDNILFTQSHWLDSVTGPFDVIVSNPPYIAEGDPHLQKLGFEPAPALVSGPDGLDAIREIISTGYHKMNQGGILLLEHGFDQAAAVRQMMDDQGYQDTQTLNDAAGTERATMGYRPREG